MLLKARNFLAAVALTVSTAASFAQAPLSTDQLLLQTDRQEAQILAIFDIFKGTPIHYLSAPDARQQFAAEDAAKLLARASNSEAEPVHLASVYDLKIPGPESTQLPIRVYTPVGQGPFPVVVYYHGGGFVVATIDTYDASARALASMAGAVVLSVEYRKAPENPFPAAYNDAYAAYQFAHNYASTFNGNPERIAVAGESAGGNLATEVCLRARDEGFPMPVHQLLVYPVTSSDTGQASDIQYANAIPLNLADLQYYLSKYVPSNVSANDPRVAPTNATLRGLPPATIISAQIDPLQSDGIAYATKLKAAGVAVNYMLYPKVTHEFFGMGSYVQQAKDAESFAASMLRAAF